MSNRRFCLLDRDPLPDMRDHVTNAERLRALDTAAKPVFTWRMLALVAVMAVVMWVSA